MFFCDILVICFLFKFQDIAEQIDFTIKFGVIIRKFQLIKDLAIVLILFRFLPHNLTVFQTGFLQCNLFCLIQADLCLAGST